MARLFVKASSEFLEGTSAPISAYPYTMAGWIKPTTSTATQSLWTVGSTTAGQYVALGLLADNTSFVETDPNSGSLNDTLGPAGVTIPDGTWGHVAAVGTSATNRVVYTNGTAGSTNTTSTAFPTVNRTTIGALNFGGTHLSFMDGAGAECAIWNVALTAVEIQALAAGITPLLVRPASLVMYVPLLGDTVRDVVGGFDFTATGTTKTRHVRIFRSTIPQSLAVPTASGSSPQTVTPAAIASGSTVLSPTLAPGAVTVTPSAVASGATLFAPSISTSVTVQPAALASGATVAAPTLSPGAVTVSPAAITSGSQVFAPSTGGVTTITPGTIGSGSQLYAPSLEYTLAPAAIAAASAVRAPTLTPGAVTITPAHLASGEQVFTPSVSGGDVPVVTRMPWVPSMPQINNQDVGKAVQ